MKKMVTLSYKEYEKLETAINGLGWVWQSYQREFPDGWYEFKYQTILRHFIVGEKEENLKAKVQHKRFPKCVKMPLPIYREMKELAEIYADIQTALENPPYKNP